MSTPYPAQAQTFLRTHGIREGSLVTLTLHNGDCWQGQIVRPPLERTGPWLYLSTEDGHELGLALEDIQEVEEHGHQAPARPAPLPPRWALPEAEVHAQRSLFAQTKAPAAAPDRVYVIECGHTMARYTLTPPPSSQWQEVLATTWSHAGPLGYQTLFQTPEEVPPHAWQPLVQVILSIIARRPQGIVLLLPDAAMMATAPHIAMLLTPLPCPIVCLGGQPTEGDLAQAQDALLAAVYAARYIDVGEVMICCPALVSPPETSAHAPWQTPPGAHQERAPYGSYHLQRATASTRSRDLVPGFVAAGAPPLGTIHRRQCHIHSLDAAPLGPLDPGACTPLGFAEGVLCCNATNIAYAKHQTPTGVVFVTPQPREIPAQALDPLHDWQAAGVPVFIVRPPETAATHPKQRPTQGPPRTYHGIPSLGVMLPEMARLKLAWALLRAKSPEALWALL